MMAEPLLSFDISKRRRGNRSALPPRPPNAWILYRSDKMREIQRERKSSMLLNNKPKSLSSSNSTNNVNFDYPSVQAGDFIKEDSNLSTQGSSSKESIKSLSPKDIDRLDENAGGANCLQAQISRMVSQMWKNENEQVKQHYAKLAAEHKLEHQRQYPNYRYQPKRRSRLSLPTHNSHPLPNDFRRIEAAQHPDGHYDSNRGTSKRDWHTASWPSWQYPWNTPQGHNPYDSTLSLQQMGYGSNSRPTFRTGNNPHDKRSQSDGIYNHPLMPQSEQQRYTPLPTTNGMPSPALLPPTTQSGRSMVQVSMQPQHYPIQSAYVQSAQVQINTQVPESNRTYSDNLAASIPLPQQTITTSTYSSDPTMFSHSQPNSQLYENNLRRISPSQSSSSNAYTSISPDAHQQHLQLHPTNNQRSQQMPEMDMLQNLLATGNTTAYNGSPAFPK